MKMTIWLVGLLVAVTLGGCRPDAATKPPPPREAVTGAFGFKLGERLDEKFEVTTNADGAMIWYGGALGEGQRPFRWVDVEVADDRRIYSITAKTERTVDDMRALRKTLVTRLAEKYGVFGADRNEPIWKLTRGQESVSFGERPRNIMLWSGEDSLTVSYTDWAIAAEVEKQREAERQRVAKGL